MAVRITYNVKTGVESIDDYTFSPPTLDERRASRCFEIDQEYKDIVYEIVEFPEGSQSQTAHAIGLVLKKINSTASPSELSELSALAVIEVWVNSMKDHRESKKTEALGSQNPESVVTNYPDPPP